MPLLFVYGSLKQGFANEHVNTGRRVAGQYRTQERYPFFLLGEGEVPCVVARPGTGAQIVGELYEATPADIARMDLLERIGEPNGYERRGRWPSSASTCNRRSGCRPTCM